MVVFSPSGWLRRLTGDETPRGGGQDETAPTQSLAGAATADVESGTDGDGYRAPVADARGAEWPYCWAEHEVERVEGQPVVSHGPDEYGDSETFAGPLGRAMITGPRDNPDQPLYLGIGTRTGRHAGIERKYLFRHTAVFGTTGYGKSTLLNNAALQVIESGAGCCIIDPKGDDSEELMQRIPDHRLDDVVWIEPGDTRSSVAGFNFLDVGVGEDHPMYDTAVESVVDDLKTTVGLDEYWGPLMDGITTNLIRGTTRLPYDFTLLDLYYIIATEENREKYAELVEREGLNFISTYADKIAELEDDKLDALRRRLKDWVEDPEARQVISHRETKIDIETVVEDGKILIVRMGAQTEDLKRMVGTAILRRIWSSIRSRAATSRGEREPFYLFADEFDLIATEDANVNTMLSKARSLSLALFLCCQQPAQLPDEVVSGIYGNCDTVLSFSPGSPKDAKAVARNLDMDWRTLRRESNYHVWLQLTLSSTRERSEAFRVYTLPPAPPVRTEAEAMHAIECAVRRDGRPPQTDDEIRAGLLIDDGETHVESATPTGAFSVTPAVQTAACQAVYDAAIRAEADDGYIPLSEVAPDVRRSVADEIELSEERTDELLGSKDKVFRRVVSALEVDENCGEETPGLTLRDGGDGAEVRPTTAAIREILDVGDSESSGGAKHYLILRAAYEEFVRRGARVTIPTQGGDGSLPDAIVEPTDESDPVVEALTGGERASIEAECTTSDTKPAQTTLNLSSAVGRGERTLFLAHPDDARRVWSTLAEKPLYASERDEEAGETLLHNSTSKVRIGGELAYRAGSRVSRWVRDETTGEIVLRDDAGTEHARFNSAEDVFTDAEAYAAVGDDAATDDLRTIRAPVIPGYVFDDEPPEPDSGTWELLVVDGGDLGVYDPDGEQKPLDTLLEDGEPTSGEADESADAIMSEFLD